MVTKPEFQYFPLNETLITMANGFFSLELLTQLIREKICAYYVEVLTQILQVNELDSSDGEATSPELEKFLKTAIKLLENGDLAGFEALEVPNIVLATPQLMTIYEQVIATTEGQIVQNIEHEKDRDKPTRMEVEIRIQKWLQRLQPYSTTDEKAVVEKMKVRKLLNDPKGSFWKMNTREYTTYYHTNVNKEVNFGPGNRRNTLILVADAAAVLLLAFEQGKLNIDLLRRQTL